MKTPLATTAVALWMYLLCALPLAAAELPCESGWRPNDGGVSTAEAVALELDAAIAGALERVAATPGLAVGVLRRGEVVYARGFGVRDLETCAPVTPESVFYLLSVTKSFTGMAAAVLQEEGAIELDKALPEYLPEARAAPPMNLAQTSLRDLLNHRPGFHNGAINFRSFLPGNLDEAALLHVLEHHSRPLEITFHYANTGYVVAGAALARATGKKWRELLEERIFAPLGMTSSSTSIERATRGEFAYPYGLGLGGSFEPGMVKVEEQMHAAGGASSNVVDLLRWVEVNLEGGALDGEQVLPALAVRQAHAPQIQFDWEYGRYRRFAYGLGVYNSTMNGELILHHFGGPIHVSFAPQHRLGLVLLSAGPDSTGFVHALAASLYDLLLGKPDARATLAASLDEAKQKLAERLEVRREREAGYRARQGELIRPAAAYQGSYVSDRLGEMIVTEATTGAGLDLGFGVLSMRLEPLDPDVFLARFPEVGPAELRFDGWEEGRPGVLDWGGRIFERQ